MIGLLNYVELEYSLLSEKPRHPVLFAVLSVKEYVQGNPYPKMNHDVDLHIHIDYIIIWSRCIAFISFVDAQAQLDLLLLETSVKTFIYSTVEEILGVLTEIWSSLTGPTGAQKGFITAWLDSLHSCQGISQLVLMGIHEWLLKNLPMATCKPKQRNPFSAQTP